MTFADLEMTILKFHDFSRFPMTVRTLIYIYQPHVIDLTVPSSSEALIWCWVKENRP